jgi:hypothetical protein
LLTDYTIFSAEETTLGANQWLSDSSRFTWNKISGGNKEIYGRNPLTNDMKQSNKLAIELQPMEVKTFIVKMTPK